MKELKTLWEETKELFKSLNYRKSEKRYFRD